MKIIYFDLCAVVIFLIILWTCITRKLTRGRTNRLYIAVSSLSLACTIADIIMEVTVNPAPLSARRVTFGLCITFLYFILRNVLLCVCFYMLLSITRTEYHLRSLKLQMAFWAPYAVLLVLLVRNFFTRDVFNVTAETGYTREPLMILFYIVALLYGVIGLTYCLFCRKYLPSKKWISVFSVYVLNFIAVVVQFFWPILLVEMFATAAGLLMILLQVMRPEENMDPTLEVRSWRAYQSELSNLMKTGQKLQIVVAQLTNASELRNYLGDTRYDELVHRGINVFRHNTPPRISARRDIYFERPGTMYVIFEDTKKQPEEIAQMMQGMIEHGTSIMTEEGLRVEIKACLIECPNDLKTTQDVINLGHRFTSLGDPDQIVFRADQLVSSRDFAIFNHTEDILNRAITGDTIEMHYQPIYDIRSKRFRSAEALVRLRDTTYGMIPPGVFIPAAERSGLIVNLGRKIIEAIFRFMSEHDLEALGIDFIEINLSVAQCADKALYDMVRDFEKRYAISPEHVLFEITESTFDNLSDTCRNNLRKLSAAGYGFALDDYGTGYTNIKRLSHIEFGVIKIDKSMVDELPTMSGRLIMDNTLHMMHDLEKEIVVEGVETKEALDTLATMGCDEIQGFYFSKPLPEEEFLRFIGG